MSACKCMHVYGCMCVGGCLCIYTYVHVGASNRPCVVSQDLILVFWGQGLSLWPAADPLVKASLPSCPRVSTSPVL